MSDSAELSTLKPVGDLVVAGDAGKLEPNIKMLDAIRHGELQSGEIVVAMREGLDTLVRKSAAGLAPNEVSGVVKAMMAADPTAGDGYQLTLSALQQVEEIKAVVGGKRTTLGIAQITEKLPVETTMRLGMCDIGYCRPARLASYIRYLSSMYARADYVTRETSADPYVAELKRGDLYTMEEHCNAFVDAIGDRNDSDDLAERIARNLFVDRRGQRTLPSEQVMKFLEDFSEDSDLITEVLELVKGRLEDLGVVAAERGQRAADYIDDEKDVDTTTGYQLE